MNIIQIKHKMIYFLIDFLKIYITVYLYKIMIFQELNYPRRKNFIKNLNILLEAAPSKSLTAKFLSNNSNQTKVQTINSKKESSIIQVIKDNRLCPKKIVQLRIANQQNKIKVKQKLKLRYSQSANIRAQSSRNSYMKSQKLFYDSDQNPWTRRQVITDRPRRGNQILIYNDDQMFQAFQEISKQKFLSNSQIDGKDQNLFRSKDIKRNSQGLLYDYSPKQKMKKQYLKKGQRIKSTIVRNLIKSTLLKKHDELNPLKITSSLRAEQQMVQNNEIVRMIKLFKGTHALDIERKTPALTVEQVREKQRKNARQRDPLHIQGWVNQSLEQEENDLDKKNCSIK